MAALRSALVAMKEAHDGPKPQAWTEPGGFARVAEVLLTCLVGSSAVARWLPRLREDGLLALDELAGSEVSEIAHGLNVHRPTQLHALATLQKLGGWMAARGEHEVETLETPRLREALRALPGLGHATVEALLLHAFRRPVFPLDRTIYRIAVRHGWVDPDQTFDEARVVLEQAVDGDLADLSAASAQLHEAGRRYCKTSKPLCEDCALRPWLPAGGPIEPF